MPAPPVWPWSQIVCYFPDADDVDDVIKKIGENAKTLEPTLFGAPQKWYPPPPPPPFDPTGVILGIVFGLLLVAAIAGVACWLRKRYPAESARRWDDDYVMMNTNVLTIPLNALPHRTRKDTKKHKTGYDDEDGESLGEELENRSGGTEEDDEESMERQRDL